MERIKKIFKQVNDQYSGPIVLNRDDRDTNRHLPFTDEKAVSVWLVHVDRQQYIAIPSYILNSHTYASTPFTPTGGGRTNED